MAASFKNSAWFYDTLSRLVYGKAIVNAQFFLIGYIKSNSNILIVGGGTGWILEELTRLHPSGINITYVEVAPDMMALSRKRNTGGNRIIFINNVIEKVSLPANFDVVITPFLFDNFTEQTLQTVFSQINALLKSEALWLNCDFQLTGKWWQAVMLRSMFIFFRLICGIEANKLPKIENAFNANRYQTVAEKTFFGNFIVARIYQK